MPASAFPCANLGDLGVKKPLQDATMLGDNDAKVRRRTWVGLEGLSCRATPLVVWPSFRGGADLDLASFAASALSESAHYSFPCFTIASPIPTTAI